MNKLHLPDTTLVCLDCRNYTGAINALTFCTNHVQFDDILFLTNKKLNIVPGRVEFAEINSIEQYSSFILKELHKFISTKYLLLCQYDGFIINPSYWHNDFFNYDYIGAPWNHHNNQVGNGGFSFRSLKLQKIMSLNEFPATHPEDAMICRKYRNKLESNYGIKFAPIELASIFSFEGSSKDLKNKKTFGFHCKGCIETAKKISHLIYPQSVGDTYYLHPIKHIPLL